MFSKGLRALAAGLALSLLAGLPARAAWIRAETDRFIVYGEGREGWVRDYAVKLTAFDAVLRAFNPVAADRPPGQKVEVYLVKGLNGLREIDPRVAASVRGFYTASPEAILTAVDSGGPGGDDFVLFHEYAHHFMFENFPAAYPAWLVEGWAEYFMTAEIGEKTVKVGKYDTGRAYWLFNSTWLPLEDLLTKRMGEIPRARRAVYYPQAWILMHYMRSDPTRAAQMDRATLAIARGAEPVKAFQDATGLTLAELTAALKRYTRLPVYSVDNPLKAPPRVTITRLPRSADDLLLAGARLDLGAPGDGRAFLEEVRARAARHPGDRLAELTLARAEFRVGDVAAGEAIMARRLAAAPEDVEALRIAGRGQIIAGGREPARQVERFRAARPYFARAYRLDQADYRILYQYAFSRTREPDFPTDNDIEALTQAYSLAPAVQETVWTTGVALLNRGRTADGMALLARIANNPHGGDMAAKARALIAGKSEAEADSAVAEEEAPAPEPPTPGRR